MLAQQHEIPLPGWLVGLTFGLLLSIPIVGFAMVAIALESRGAVLYHQTRVGRDGSLFRVHKLRTMRSGNDDAEHAAYVAALIAGDASRQGALFKLRDDARCTRVGRFLRRTSIDELPQLWNVLRGDMSLVGPRPPLPKEVEQYERWQRRRLSMKPGITCLWQVSGRNRIGFEEWMRLDLAYIDNWSLGLDLKILARTVPAVVLARGAN